MSYERYSKNASLLGDLLEYQNDVLEIMLLFLGYCKARSGYTMRTKLYASNKLLSEIDRGLVKGVGNLDYVDKKDIPESGKA